MNKTASTVMFRFAEVQEEWSGAGVPECSWLRPACAGRSSARPHRVRETLGGDSELCEPQAEGWYRYYTAV